MDTTRVLPTAFRKTVLTTCYRRASIALAIFVACTAAHAADSPQSLGRYAADSSKVTVSGISSGGYMAAQLGVAYSSLFSGVGVIAAGPYGCAHTEAGLGANLNRALGPCMVGGYSSAQKWRCFVLLASCPGADGPDAAASIDLAKRAEARGAIDPLTNLARQRVLIVSGAKDTTVYPKVVTALRRFYEAFAPRANVKHDVIHEAAHTFPTDDFARGNECSAAKPPFVSDCDYDAARALFTHFYGPLRPRNDAAPQGALIEFDQTPFFAPGANAGMANTAYVYVPRRCAEGGCAVHVALHGCKQTAAQVDKAFVTGAGYNRWADANGIVVLYPQVRKAGLGSSNPENCWDWWGYTGAGWYEKRSVQMTAIVAMVQHLASRGAAAK